MCLYIVYQYQSQMVTRTVLINLGPQDILINCAHARASWVVERAPVTSPSAEPLLAEASGNTNVILSLKSSFIHTV